MNKSIQKGVFSLPRAWLSTQAVSGGPDSVPAHLGGGVAQRNLEQAEAGMGWGMGRKDISLSSTSIEPGVPELGVTLRPPCLPSSWGACFWNPQPSRISIPSLPRKGTKARGRRGAGRGADKSAAGATWRSRGARAPSSRRQETSRCCPCPSAQSLPFHCH